MSQFQQGDVFLYQSRDGGEIEAENDVIAMTARFDTAMYLSLFGGNREDAGQDDTTQQWWGNLDQVNSDFQYRSRTQYLLRSLPQTSGNLSKIEEAVKNDLEMFDNQKILSQLTVRASIPAINRVEIMIEALAEGEPVKFNFVENWTAPQ